MADQSGAPDKGEAGDSESKRGRGRPPKHSQWKPGQSRNLSGRGKGTRVWAVVFEEELAELLGFPSSRFFDQVDSTSQALDFLQQRFSDAIVKRERKRPSGARRPAGLRGSSALDAREGRHA